MDCEEFEKLVSDWLDEPERDDLRRRIDAALDADPRLRPVLDEWRTFDMWLRSHAPPPDGVDWAEQRGRIAVAMGAPVADDTSLDRLLAGLPGVDPQVDWARLRGRIVAAAARERRAARRGLRRGVAVLVVGAAAAAAVVWAVWPTAPIPSTVPEQGTVRIIVQLPSEPSAADTSAGTVVVHVSARGSEGTVPERIFIVDPVVSAAPLAEIYDVY